MTENDNLNLDCLWQLDNESQAKNFSYLLLIKAWELAQKYGEDIYDRTDNNLKIAEIYKNTDRREIANKIVEYTLELNHQGDRNPFAAYNYNWIANYYLKNDKFSLYSINIYPKVINLLKIIPDC